MSSKMKLSAVFLLHLVIWSTSAQDVTVDLRMPSTCFIPASTFSMEAIIHNTGETYSNAKLFAALTIGTGDYWFFPSWTHYPDSLDWETTTFEASADRTASIVPSFPWPEGTGDFSGAMMISAVVSQTGDLISNVETIEFGWLAKPQIISVDPITAPPGKPLKLIGRGLNYPDLTPSIRIGTLSMIVIKKGTDESGIDFLLTIVPFLAPAQYPVTVEINGHSSEPNYLTIEDVAPTGKPLGQVASEVHQGMSYINSQLRTNIIPEAVTRDIIPIEDEYRFLEAIDRADLFLTTANSEYEKLDDQMKLRVESIIVQNNMDVMLKALSTMYKEHEKRGFDDVSDATFRIIMDSTSAIVSLIDEVWSIIDIASFLGTIGSGEAAMPAYGFSQLMHFSIGVVDHLIDAGIQTDLTDVSFQGLGINLTLYRNNPVDLIVMGTFGYQESRAEDSIEIVIDTVLDLLSIFGYGVDGMEAYLGDVITGMGLNMADFCMPDGFMGFIQDSPQTIPIPFNYYEGFDFSELLEETMFESVIGNILDLLNDLHAVSWFLPDTGIKPWCSNCMTWELEYEHLFITAAGTCPISTKLTLSWHRFEELDVWSPFFEGLEFPEEQQKTFNVTVINGAQPTETPVNPTATPSSPTRTPTWTNTPSPGTPTTTPTRTPTSEPDTPSPTPTPVPTGLVYIAPGTFTMGSPFDEACRDTDETEHTVTLTLGVHIMVTEVTRQMWADLKAVQPTLPEDPSSKTSSPPLNHPVQMATWYESVLFANLLSVQYGFTQCYYKDEEFVTPLDATNYTSGSFYCNFSADGYRLPTESEWEYVCRAGTTEAFSCNEPNFTSESCNSCTEGTHATLDQYCVYCANNWNGTAAVGSKIPNPAGLYDIHGNVCEWCWDWAGTYPTGSATDPTGPSTGTYKVWRGGNWDTFPRYCRSAFRYGSLPGNRYNDVGFRLLRSGS